MIVLSDLRIEFNLEYNCDNNNENTGTKQDEMPILKQEIFCLL